MRAWFCDVGGTIRAESNQSPLVGLEGVIKRTARRLRNRTSDSSSGLRTMRQTRTVADNASMILTASSIA